MTGWLIYEKESAERNAQFIRFWKDEAAVHSVDMKLVFADALPSEYPDFAVNRTMNYQISEQLEKEGVSVYNSSYVSKICNDKWNTYVHAEQWGIPFPETHYLPDPEQNPYRCYPYVLKSCHGHGGTEVFWIASEEDRVRIGKQMKGVPSVVQKPVSELGKDLRVYVLGGNILKGMLRTSRNDFRSNFCLGGSAEIFPMTAELCSMVARISEKLGDCFVGIDFLFDCGKPVLNEIEDVVGCRMLYHYTDLNPVRSYLEMILQKRN